MGVQHGSHVQRYELAYLVPCWHSIYVFICQMSCREYTQRCRIVAPSVISVAMLPSTKTVVPIDAVRNRGKITQPSLKMLAGRARHDGAVLSDGEASQFLNICIVTYDAPMHVIQYPTGFITSFPQMHRPRQSSVICEMLQIPRFVTI